MPAPWIVLYLTMAAALTVAAGWQWGLGGAGLALSVLTSAGVGYLARTRLEPGSSTLLADDDLSTSPPLSEPDSETVEGSQLRASQELAQRHARELALTQRIVDLAQGASSLSQAMHRIGEAHARPHAPQCDALAAVSTQAAAHTTRPGVHSHRPLTHCCPAPQAR